MRSRPVAALLVDLEVAKTHCRPYVSDDNPCSEAQFKTLKYRPDFPVRFGCFEDARSHCHSGIAYITPATAHFDQAATVYQARAKTLDCLPRQPIAIQKTVPLAAQVAQRRFAQLGDSKSLTHSASSKQNMVNQFPLFDMPY
jgi:hypothetical protein